MTASLLCDESPLAMHSCNSNGQEFALSNSMVLRRLGPGKHGSNHHKSSGRHMTDFSLVGCTYLTLEIVHESECQRTRLDGMVWCTVQKDTNWTYPCRLGLLTLRKQEESPKPDSPRIRVVCYETGEVNEANKTSAFSYVRVHRYPGYTRAHTGNELSSSCCDN
jgi:hypothetical protein